MVATVSGKQQLDDVNDLLDRLDRLREAGAEVHDIRKSDAGRAGEQDSFHIAYTSAGTEYVREFTLPKAEADFLSKAITAGLVSAEVVNSGRIAQTLLDYAAARTGPSLPIAELRVDRGAGKGV